MRAGQEVFTREIESVGFREVRQEKLLKDNYLVRFEKVAAEGERAKPPDKEPRRRRSDGPPWRTIRVHLFSRLRPRFPTRANDRVARARLLSVASGSADARGE